MKRNFSQEEITDILIRTRLFRNIPKQQVEELVFSNIGKLRFYYKGERILCCGDIIDAVSVVLRGTILVSLITKEGTESTVHVLKERKTVGLEVVENPFYKSAFDLTAQTDVALYSFPKLCFQNPELINEGVSRQLLLNVISLMTHENLRQNQKFHILSMGTIRKKLQLFLYYEYEKCNSREFDLSFNRETLATYLCINRSALSREISKMEKEGLIETKGKHIRILDDSILTIETK